MKVLGSLPVLVAVAMAGLLTAVPFAQQGPRPPMPLEPVGNANEAVYPAYDGWGEAHDGSYYIVLGYMNRNAKQAVEVPIGPLNKIEPAGPDYGQPTVFEPGRHKTVFAIKVPKDFGEKRLTWTLVANGQPAVVTFYLNREYNMSFYSEASNGNVSPRIKFGPTAPELSGPNVGFAQTLQGTVGSPVSLKLWAADAPPTEKNWERIISAAQPRRRGEIARDQIAVVDGRVIGAAAGRAQTESVVPDMTVVWKKMRGPGTVTITPPALPLTTNGDPKKVVEADVTATFSEPGEYVLRAEPVEFDDGFDGLCCVTFANVKVIVK